VTGVMTVCQNLEDERMPETFAMAPLDPLRAITRPARPRRIQRPRHVATPAAWMILWVEHLGIDKVLAWAAWQGFSSSRYSEVQALARPIMVWPRCAETLPEVGAKGVTPGRLLKACELLVTEGKLSPQEGGILEEAILRHLDRDGAWCSEHR
jgi:hypothetical protein